MVVDLSPQQDKVAQAGTPRVSGADDLGGTSDQQAGQKVVPAGSSLSVESLLSKLDGPLTPKKGTGKQAQQGDAKELVPTECAAAEGN